MAATMINYAKETKDILKTKTDSLPFSFSSFLLSAKERKIPYEIKKADIFIDVFLMASRERHREKIKERESNESQKPRLKRGEKQRR